MMQRKNKRKILAATVSIGLPLVFVWGGGGLWLGPFNKWYQSGPSLKGDGSLHLIGHYFVLNTPIFEQTIQRKVFTVLESKHRKRHLLAYSN